MTNTTNSINRIEALNKGIKRARTKMEELYWMDNESAYQRYIVYYDTLEALKIKRSKLYKDLKKDYRGDGYDEIKIALKYKAYRNFSDLLEL